MPLNETGPVIAWRNNDRLNPCSANPGLFKRMLKRQQAIKTSHEVPSLSDYKPIEEPAPPRTRLENPTK